MSPVSGVEAEIIKKRGNELFAAQDYEGAIKCFTEAMKLDDSQWTYPLNRCFAHLKLQRWAEAEADATATLRIDGSNAKAWYRRSLARAGLGKFTFAHADIWTYGLCRGDWKTVIDENAKIAIAEADSVAASMNSPSRGFEISGTSGQGNGAFATRNLFRGDLILIEKPLYVVSESASAAEVAMAVKGLSDDERRQLSELQNTFADQFDDQFFGIHKTNSFGAAEDKAAMFLLASRFNHSCSPNARHSWHAPTKTFRIYALRAITPGEELFVSYISSRNVYGSTKAQRQQRLQSMLGFVCACTACTLPAPDQAASDRRRAELKRLWDAVPLFAPHQTLARLHAIERALKLMKEEGYHADSDDFSNDAAAICTYHSDWASAVFWAMDAYGSRVAEFGADSLRAKDKEILTFLIEPHKYGMAGLGTPKVFAVRPP